MKSVHQLPLSGHDICRAKGYTTSYREKMLVSLALELRFDAFVFWPQEMSEEGFMNMSRKVSLTLFEHEAKEYNWTDLDLVELAKLSRMAGVEVLHATVIGGQRVLQATQHVGVFCFRRTTVQVLPKIYKLHTMELRPDQEREATQNLLYLLRYALQLPVREYGLAPLSDQYHDWFEGLISIFTAHLLEKWQRGPYRHYQEVKDTLPFLKGKLDVASQLRHPESKHRFPVTYDEYTADVPLNRVFRFVVERLWLITRDANNKLRLTRLRQWMEEITLLPQMTVSDTNTIVMTRLNQRFASLLELARLFLDDGSLQYAQRYHCRHVLLLYPQTADLLVLVSIAK